MKRTIALGGIAGLLLALSVGLVSSAPKPGTVLTVRAIKTRLMAQPRFLGAYNATVYRGTRVRVVQTRGPWYLVDANGKQGWVYRTRLVKRAIRLRSGATGSGTTAGEAELAGRGFGPATEQKFRAAHPNLDYRRLDRIQQFDVDPASVAQFYQEGGLHEKGGL